MLLGLVRVDADAGPDIRLALGSGDDVAPLAPARRRVEESLHARRASPFEHCLLVLNQALVVQVAVAIDQHQATASSGSSSLGNSPAGASIRKCASASGEYQVFWMPTVVLNSSATPIASR